MVGPPTIAGAITLVLPPKARRFRSRAQLSAYLLPGAFHPQPHNSLESPVMRRHRQVRYPLAFLTVAVGIAAVPAVVTAADGTDPVEPADGATPAAPTPAPPAEEEPAPAPPTTEAPPPPETTEPPADPEPPVTTPDEPEAPAPPDDHALDSRAGSRLRLRWRRLPRRGRPRRGRRPSRHGRLERTPSDDNDELDIDVPDAAPDAAPDVQVVRPIAFPVLGSVNYGNDWGNCRDGCARRHQGTDMIGVRMQPLLAAVDGTVTRIRYENVGTAGTVISITGADGWYYNYFHVNNDTPGTDDGLAGPEWQVSPQLTVGSTVKAGQVIGYMGDSGNAEGSVPHLHFEIRTPDRTPVNPYPSLAAAQAPETCMPVEDVALTDPTELTPAAVSIIPIDGRGRWLIDPDGRLFAEGPAAHSGPPTGEACVGTPAPGVTPEAVVTPAPVVEPAPAPVAPAAPCAGGAAADDMDGGAWRLAVGHRPGDVRRLGHRRHRVDGQLRVRQQP